MKLTRKMVDKAGLVIGTDWIGTGYWAVRRLILDPEQAALAAAADAALEPGDVAFTRDATPLRKKLGADGIRALADDSFASALRLDRKSNGQAIAAEWTRFTYDCPKAGAVYLVRAGDTLVGISAKYWPILDGFALVCDSTDPALHCVHAVDADGEVLAVVMPIQAVPSECGWLLKSVAAKAA